MNYSTEINEENVILPEKSSASDDTHLRGDIPKFEFYDVKCEDRIAERDIKRGSEVIYSYFSFNFFVRAVGPNPISSDLLVLSSSPF